MTGRTKLNGRAEQQTVAHQTPRISSLPLLTGRTTLRHASIKYPQPKNKKRPDGRQATGRDLAFRSKLRLCCPREGKVHTLRSLPRIQNRQVKHDRSRG